MADTLNINVEPPKPITAKLGTKSYKVRPIKGSLGMALAQRLQGDKSPQELVDGLNHVIDIVFGKTDAPKIKERLADPEDALDFTHITELLTALIEKSTGNPTT